MTRLETKYHKLLEKNCIYDAFFRVNEFVFEKNEDRSTFKRFVVERPDATAVLLYNKPEDTIIFVKQLRAPAFGREDDPYILELPAGVLEPGENPIDTIIREAYEETGFHIHEPRHIGSFYASPGTFAEKIHTYYHEVNNENQSHDGGGLDEESEDIELIAIPREKVYEMMDTGRIIDAKTLVSLLWFRGNGNA